MLQGFYSAASGMLMQQRHLNVIANNLNNTQTPGFKTNRLVSTTFDEALQARLEGPRSGLLGSRSEATRIVEEVADIWTTAGFTETQRPFDFGITGYGFFNVESFADGETYLTRNGQFDLDEEGFLILRDRGYVLGTAGQRLQIGTSEISVDENGAITNDATGAAMGQLMITAPTEDNNFELQRNGMYTAAAVNAIADPQIVQGAYEQSNVHLSDELAQMIMTQRNFSTAAQALQFIDATYAKAVNIAAL